ncbi:MAG: hypothetical protein R3B93_29285, partial [Bacteroidia bacterium]
NHRNGYPGVFSGFNYDYQEPWFETWWDDAGVISSTTHTPAGLHVWGGGIDTILFCFSKQVEGDSNFLYFHQVDFSVTQIRIQASNCGILLDHTLLELNESSGSPSFTTSSTEATFTMSPGANRRYLVRFNQDFDFVRVIEDNSSDLLAVGFMGFGNFKDNPCSNCFSKNNPVLSLHSVQLEAQEQWGKIALRWNSVPNMGSHYLEKLNSNNSWVKIQDFGLQASYDQYFSYLDSFPINGENIYRIRVVDPNGVEFFSNLEEINIQIKEAVSIFPNPANEGYLYIQFDKPIDKNALASLRCYDQNGKEVEVHYSIHNEYVIKTDVIFLPLGLYYFLVRDSQGHLHSQKFQIK